MIYRAFFSLGLMFTNLSVLASDKVTAVHIQTAVVKYLEREYSQFFSADHVHNNVVFHVGSLDSRLRLAACNHPIETQLNSPNALAQQVSVKVRCTAPSHWSLYVPVKVELFEQVVVAAKPLAKGTILEDHHLTQARVDVASSRGGYFEAPKGAIGMELRRPLRAGDTLTNQLLRAPKVINRGETVTLEASNRAIAVVTQAKALSHGRIGQTIRVQNLSSKRVVEATVKGPGRVTTRATL